MTLNDERSIGSHGLEAAPLGIGCMGMSEFYGPADEGEAVRTIQRALELGVTPARQLGRDAAAGTGRQPRRQDAQGEQAPAHPADQVR